ncbi:unnamed protein product [Camellia sinensis]
MVAVKKWRKLLLRSKTMGVKKKRVDYKMVFKSLKEINLECLPNLSGFCTGGDDFPFEWPSLEILRVRDCPKMMTSAATTSAT